MSPSPGASTQGRTAPSPPCARTPSSGLSDPGPPADRPKGYPCRPNPVRPFSEIRLGCSLAAGMEMHPFLDIPGQRDSVLRAWGSGPRPAAVLRAPQFPHPCGQGRGLRSGFAALGRTKDRRGRSLTTSCSQYQRSAVQTEPRLVRDGLSGFHLPACQPRSKVSVGINLFSHVPKSKMEPHRFPARLQDGDAPPSTLMPVDGPCPFARWRQPDGKHASRRLTRHVPTLKMASPAKPHAGEQLAHWLRLRDMIPPFLPSPVSTGRFRFEP